MFTKQDLDNFAVAIVENYNIWSDKDADSQINPMSVIFEEGKKYIRVIRVQGIARSAHSFVEIETGNVWKAASWKVPAKNKPRGHITKLTQNIVYWTGAY